MRISHRRRLRTAPLSPGSLLLDHSSRSQLLLDRGIEQYQSSVDDLQVVAHQSIITPKLLHDLICFRFLELNEVVLFHIVVLDCRDEHGSRHVGDLNCVVALSHDLLSPINDVSLRWQVRVDWIFICSQPLGLRSTSALGFDRFSPKRGCGKPRILLRFTSNLRQLIPLRAVRRYSPVLFIAVLIAEHRGVEFGYVLDQFFSLEAFLLPLHYVVVAAFALYSPEDSLHIKRTHLILHRDFEQMLLTLLLVQRPFFETGARVEFVLFHDLGHLLEQYTIISLNLRETFYR